METTKKVSLFEINAKQREMIAEIENMEGEITPEMEKNLEITKGQLQQKSVAYLEVIKTKDAFNLLIKGEIARLNGLKKRNQGIIDRLNENLLGAVVNFGVFEVGTQKFGTRKSTSLVIYDASAVPKKFYNVVTSTTIDKNRITIAIKNGDEVKGAKLQANVNLKIN